MMKMSEQLRFIVDELPTAKEREDALYAAIDGIEKEIRRAVAVMEPEGISDNFTMCIDPRCPCKLGKVVKNH